MSLKSVFQPLKTRLREEPNCDLDTVKVWCTLQIGVKKSVIVFISVMFIVIVLTFHSDNKSGNEKMMIKMYV